MEEESVWAFFSFNWGKELKTFNTKPYEVLCMMSFLSQLSTCEIQFSSVQSLSPVWLFVTPWIAARQASLSTTNSQSSLRLMSIESVMPSSHLSSVILFSSCPQSLPASESFPMSQFFTSGGQSIAASASASVLPMNIQGLISFMIGWFDLFAV